MTVSEAVAELQRLEGQQATIEHALGEPTRRGEALRVVLAELEQAEQYVRAEEAEARLASVPALVEALQDLMAYVVELEGLHGPAVAVRGSKFPDGAAALGDRVRAVLTVYEQSQGNAE